MRKTALSALACCLLSVCRAEAAPPVRIGAAAALRGRVEALASAVRPAAKTLAGGDAVYLNDRISTGDKGHLQVILLDETVFTLGPNSTMVLDKFVYDPATGAGEVSADIVKGCFRFVTGKVAKKKPENVKVKVAAGTIGVFGTIVAGRVQDGESVVLLEGPGALNNAGEKEGRILVEGAAGGSVLLARPGYAVTVGLKGVSAGYEATPELINGLGAALSLKLPGSREGAGAVSVSYGEAEEDSGQSGAAGMDEMYALESVSGLSEGLDAAGSDAVQGEYG